jgi:hypothetical protein
MLLSLARYVSRLVASPSDTDQRMSFQYQRTMFGSELYSKRTNEVIVVSERCFLQDHCVISELYTSVGRTFSSKTSSRLQAIAPSFGFGADIDLHLTLRVQERYYHMCSCDNTLLFPE